MDSDEEKMRRVSPYLHASDVYPLSHTELLSHEPQLGHTVEKHVVELQQEQTGYQ